MSNLRFEAIESGNLRLEAVIDIAAALQSDQLEGSADGPLEDLLDDLCSGTRTWWADTCQAELAQLAKDVQELGDVDDAEEHLQELLFTPKYRNMRGFIIQVGTPRPRYTASSHSPHSYSYSWGSYFTHWFYGDTMEEAYKKASVWAQNLRIAQWEEATGKTYVPED